MDPDTAQTLGALSETAIGLYLAGGCVLVGLILLFTGSKLARIGCVLVGLALGSTLAAAVAQFLGLGPMLMVAASLIGALAGAIFAGFLFRAFVACTGALILAAAVPAAALAWQGTLSPELNTDSELVESLEATPSETAPQFTAEEISAATQQILDKLNQAIQDLTTAQEEGEEYPEPDENDDEAQTTDSLNISGTLQTVVDAFRQALSEQEDAITAWWESLSTTSRSVVVVGSVIGAILGLIIGLIMPQTAAAVDSALLGAVLIYLPGFQILYTLAPEAAASFPAGPRPAILIMGLITGFGILVQWIVFRHKTDS